jgi:hypothetical protein
MTIERVLAARRPCLRPEPLADSGASATQLCRVRSPGVGLFAGLTWPGAPRAATPAAGRGESRRVGAAKRFG